MVASGNMERRKRDGIFSPPENKIAHDLEK
jgi:hypothetical protein